MLLTFDKLLAATKPMKHSIWIVYKIMAAMFFLVPNDDVDTFNDGMNLRVTLTILVCKKKDEINIKWV